MEDDCHEIIDLYDAILMLRDRVDVHNFLKDLCTPQELSSMQERWRVCQLLEKSTLSYREIHRITNASLTTIGRVARFLKDEPYHGYRKILDLIRYKKEE